MRSQLLILACFVALACACDEGSTDAKSETGEPQAPAEMKPFDLPETTPILEGDVPLRDLKLDEPERYLPCHEFFEDSSGVSERYPFEDRARAQRVLWGCDVEAYQERDGARWVAYATPIDPSTGTKNLRVVAYDKGGKLQWSHTIDRSEQGRNYVANFRYSFIAPMDDLVCAGTLWEGGTQTHCLDAVSGDPKWTGWIPSWSGFAPLPSSDGLWVADLMAATKRYPFSGVEMAYIKLPDTGGRAALYATDSETLYYSPSRSTPPTLTAIDFESGRYRWKRELTVKPIASFRETYPEHDLLIIILGQTLVGVDTRDGRPLWGWQIGDDRPSVALHDGAVHVLHRRPELPNAIIALEPRSGERKWRSDLPTGVLEVKSAEGALFLKSIRAIQQVVGGLESSAP